MVTPTKETANQDAFGRLIADGTRNIIDLPSTYPFSPERYRIEINGTRTDIDDTSKVTKQTTEYLLEPAAGDTIRFRSAERTRYIVGYEMKASWAWALPTALGPNDTFRVGLNDTNNNWYRFEYTADSAALQIVHDTDGVVAEKTFEEPVDRDVRRRDEITYNWYGVGPGVGVVTYSEDGDQINKEVARVSRDGDTATEEPNLFLVYELDVGDSSTGKQAAIGSMGYSAVGSVTETSRPKAARFTGLSYAGTTTGDYEPLLAIRRDPTRPSIYTEFTKLNVTAASSSEVTAQAVPLGDTDANFDDPDNDDTDPGPKAPPMQNANNSVIQYTTDVSTFPDQSGTVVSTAPDPGGRQVGFASTEVSQGNKPQSTNAFRAKKPFYEDEVVIFLGRTDGGAAEDFNVEFETDQRW